MKKIILVVILVLIGGIGVGIAMWANAPKKGRVVSTTTTRAEPASYSNKVLDGKYLSFTYNGKYVASEEPAKDSFVEIHMLRASTTYDKQISVLVSELPTGSLNDYGAYLLRKKRPDLYDARQVPMDGAVVDVFVKKGGGEQTALLTKGGKVVTLSFTTANQSDTLTAEVDEILKTFKWKL